MSLGIRRWIVIAAGVMASMCMGAGYAFSVFKKGLIEELQCTPQQAALAFSLSFIFLPVGMLICGWLSRRLGSRVAVTIGSLTFGLGTFLAGFSHSIWWLYLTYGVMISVGNGVTYAGVIATAVRWFPDRKGLASGLVVGALGAGTLVIARAGGAMLGSGMDVMTAIKILGLCYIAVGLIASQFISEPPKDYAPAVKASAARAAAPAEDVVWTQMITRPYFWVMFVVYVCGTFPGLMLISQAKDVATEVSHVSLAVAATMVGILGAANAVGRMAWGAVSDKIGRLNAVTTMALMNALAMFLMPRLLGTDVGLLIGFVVTGLCFGGCLGTFPSICADAFGSRNMEINYAVLFFAFSVAGYFGPLAGADLRAASGGFTSGFMVAASISALGLALSVVGRFVQPKRKG